MFASINGTQVTKADVTISYRGPWLANVVTAEAVTLDGQVTIVMGDMTLVGTITRGGSYTGASSFRVVAGAGGWMTTVTPQHFRNPGGVKASAVLRDTAKLVGETIDVTEDRTVGANFVRESAPAARVLNQLATTWWIREDGTTIVGPRPSSVIASEFEVISANREAGQVVVATDTPSHWVPGRQFSSATLTTPLTISTVVHRMTASKFRTEVWIG